MPFVSACGLDVHYVAHGPGPDADPPTAVLLHGFTPDHRLMTGAFEPVFAARERRPGGVAWRRLYLDLPGMGRTRSAAHVTGTDVVLEVVREAVDRLVPDGRVALCGQSYGGYLARGLVASTPGRFSGMALVCPMLVADHAERDVPPHRVLVRDPDLAAGLAVDAEFREIAVVQTQETFRRTQQEVVPGLAEADEAALDRIRQGWAGGFALEPPGRRTTSRCWCSRDGRTAPRATATRGRCSSTTRGRRSRCSTGRGTTGTSSSRSSSRRSCTSGWTGWRRRRGSRTSDASTPHE